MSQVIALFITVILEYSLFKLIYRTKGFEDLMIILINVASNSFLCIFLLIWNLIIKNNQYYIFGIIIVEIIVFSVEVIFCKKIINRKLIVLYSLGANVLSLLVGLFSIYL